MSVNFSKPHRADVPVVDLDDPGDDGLAHESYTDHFRLALHLDYAQQPGWLDRLQNYFRPNRPQAYELLDYGDDFFIVYDDDDSSNNTPGEALRVDPRSVKRLNQKLNSTILAFACGLVFLLALLYLRRGLPPLVPLKPLVYNGTHPYHPTTIMVLLDGFHPHYISEKTTPHLHKMMNEDFGAPYMTPLFPLLTFPNHWTLVTGLYPAEHGIVGNTFWDPKLKLQFINTNPKFGLDPRFWQGGEPIWTTAFKQGVKSAIHMWPGSEVPLVGDRGPSFIDKYNGKEPLDAKVSRLMVWLDMDIESRPELVLAYVPTIDQIGHKFGISGANLTAALASVDGFVGLLQSELAARNLDRIVNLVVVSDHGMAPTSNDRLLFLDDVVDMSKIEHIDGWPLFGLRPHAQYSVEEVYDEIKASLGDNPNYRLYLLDQFPPEWHFGGTHQHSFDYRLAPVWLVPEVGYSITTRKQYEDNNNDYYPKGVHGYNNTELLMRAIFLGQGPYFRTKLDSEKKVQPFANVDVYNLICESLNLVPGPNNGTYAISLLRALPDDWSDSLVYPDLSYEVLHIVDDATYDRLWREPKPAELAKPAKTAEKESSEGSQEKTAEKESSEDSPKTDAAAHTAAGESLAPKATLHSTTSHEGFFHKVWQEVGDAMSELDEHVGDFVDAVEGLFDGPS